MRRPTIFPCLLLFLITAPVSTAQIASDFAGIWVLQLQGKYLMVLKLQSGVGASLITGSLDRPSHFNANASFVSAISRDSMTEPIVSSVWRNHSLIVTVQNPKDSTDKDIYELLLTPSHVLSLRPADFPMDPWILTRATDNPVVATDWDSTRTYAFDDTGVSSPEMTAIYEADQKPRLGDMTKIDWKAVNAQDAERRDQVRLLLKNGKLHTGEDFEHAAFIFQHGGAPDDYLLAHTLAMIAVARGRVSALWIGAATLDRYLQNVGKPQIYGTQFKWNSKDQPTTQEPYDRALIADSLRRALGVPSQATQEEQRQKYDADRHLPSPSAPH
jgi:hypothetical protein